MEKTNTIYLKAIKIFSVLNKIFIALNLFLIAYFGLNQYFNFFDFTISKEIFSYYLVFLFINIFILTSYLFLKETFINLNLEFKIINEKIKDTQIKQAKTPNLSLKSLRKTDLFNESTLNKKTIVNVDSQFYLYKDGKQANIYCINFYQESKNTFTGMIFELNYGYKLNKNFKMIIDKDYYDSKAFLGDLELSIKNDSLEEEITNVLDFYFEEKNVNTVTIVINRNFIFFILNDYKKIENKDIFKYNDFILNFFNII